MDLIKLIEEAIEEEQAAQTKYAQIAAAASDPEIRSFFEQMVREEEMHEMHLRKRLIAIKLLEGA